MIKMRAEHDQSHDPELRTEPTVEVEFQFRTETDI